MNANLNANLNAVTINLRDAGLPVEEAFAVQAIVVGSVAPTGVFCADERPLN
jgi:hypothetical protein